MAKKKSTAKKKPTSNSDGTTFEVAIEKLRTVVNQLESGNLTLTESLEKYEQGVANLRACHAALNQAQKQIELLVNLDEDGNLICTPFDDQATYSAGSSNSPDSTKGGAVSQTSTNPNEDNDEDREDYDIDDPNSLF